jgi:RNA polymerase sigma-70 factor, ECF subfamily
MEETEIQLIKQAQQGDPVAFTQLVIRYDRRILQIALSILNNLPDSQDVYQETFMRAYKYLPSFRFECQFSSWLTRIAVNLACTRLRQRRLRKFLSLDEMDLAANQLDQESDLNHELLRQAVARLPGKLKTVITLKYFQGYKIKEIAEILQCREGTIKNYIFRAVAKLQTLYLHETG